MSDKTSIEWTATVNPDGSVTPGATWNPTRGCSRVSEGCRHCYAEGIAVRFSGPGKPFEGFAQVTAPRDALDRVGGRRNGWTARVELIEDKLTEPLRWKKPRKVFVNSMSDLFHESLPDEAIDKVFAVMALAPQHTFQVLTKRAERMREYLSDSNAADRIANVLAFDYTESRLARRLIGQDGSGYSIAPLWPLPNVWLGVSVENQHFADERIPLLLQTPAAVRFISAEPLLGPVDLSEFLPGNEWMRSEYPMVAPLSWVIVGGESGHGSRPFDIAWARKIVAQCDVAETPCFVKQLGGNPYIARDAGTTFVPDYELHLRSRKGGDMDEWPADLRVRQFPS